MTNGSFSKLRRPLLIFLLAVIVLGLLSLGGMSIYRLGQSKEKAAPTPTPAPTLVPTETVSPSPTSKPKPTATPTATPTPLPTPTSTSAPTPTLTPTPTTVSQADLYVSEYSFNHPPKQGEEFTVRIGIYNKGNAPAGGFWWEWWPTNAIKACRQRIDSLAAHGGRIVTCPYTYGGWANYTTKAVVDVDNEVIESDESNNTYTQNVIPLH